MVDPRRSIPRGAEVPFHVGVVDEEFAIGVEGEVVGVAIAGTPHIPCLAGRVGAHHIATRGEFAGGVAIAIPHSRDHQVFIPVGRQPARAIGTEAHAALRGAEAPHRLRLGDVGHGEGHIRMVAADDEQPRAVG